MRSQRPAVQLLELCTSRSVLRTHGSYHLTKDGVSSSSSDHATCRGTPCAEGTLVLGGATGNVQV